MFLAQLCCLIDLWPYYGYGLTSNRKFRKLFAVQILQHYSLIPRVSSGALVSAPSPSIPVTLSHKILDYTASAYSLRSRCGFNGLRQYLLQLPIYKCEVT